MQSGLSVKSHKVKALWGHLNCSEDVPSGNVVAHRPEAELTSEPGSCSLKGHCLGSCSLDLTAILQINLCLDRWVRPELLTGGFRSLCQVAPTREEHNLAERVSFCHCFTLLICSSRSRSISSVPYVLISPFLSGSDFREVQLK